MACIELQFNKLEPYQEFLRNPSNLNKSGVYVWGFCFVDTCTAETTVFKPYYVGKSEDNIHRRLQEHVHGIRTGTYTIMDMDILRNESYYRRIDPCDPVKIRYSNIALRNKYCSGNYPKSKLDPKEQLELIPHINFYIDNLYITYLPVDKSSFESSTDHINFIYQLERYVQDRLCDMSISSKTGSCKKQFCDNVVIKTNIGIEHLTPLFSQEQCNGI